MEKKQRKPYEKQAQSRCYSCPFRKDVPGSAHSQCMHPVALYIMPHVVAGLASGKVESIELRRTGTRDIILKTDEYGTKKGWATWPIEFDPIWITCNLPLDQPNKN